ncbi:MAG TPA: transcription elongation factor GreA [Patescibacteria group bacterium]|nr:transcription elongation factor GreA [Patescibacteria group bacterium]
MNDEFFVTHEGLEQAKKELEKRLETRKEILVRVDTARQLGDLKENGEYHAAREDQRNNERKISELEHLIKFAQVVESPSGKNTTISIGNTVRISSSAGKEFEYKIVGHNEADPSRGWISNESPIAKALMGRQKNEEVEVHLPKGNILYTILEIK